VYCALGTMAASDTVTVTVEATVLEPGGSTVVASVWSGATDPAAANDTDAASWSSRIPTTEPTTLRNCFWSILSEAAMETRRSAAAPPASIRIPRSTSWAAVSNGTVPISLRYIRTGS
jgi:hypothetical protein